MLFDCLQSSQKHSFKLDWFKTSNSWKQLFQNCSPSLRSCLSPPPYLNISLYSFHIETDVLSKTSLVSSICCDALLLSCCNPGGIPESPGRLEKEMPTRPRDLLMTKEKGVLLQRCHRTTRSKWTVTRLLASSASCRHIQEHRHFPDFIAKRHHPALNHEETSAKCKLRNIL